MDKLKELNRKLNEHANATFGNYRTGYNFNDPYKEAKRQMNLIDKRRAEKLNRRDRKLQRDKRLLPVPKV